MFPSFRDSGPFLNLLPFPTGGGGVVIPTPLVTVPFVWDDDGDSTATVTGSTDIPTYMGFDYGTVMGGPYPNSTFDFRDPDDPPLFPDNYPNLGLFTAHEANAPQNPPGGALADGTYYYRVWAGTPAGFSGYITGEQSGTISSAAAIGLEGSVDFMAQESGLTDLILMESGVSTDISGFSAATALGGTEVIAGDQGGNSRKVSIDQIKTYVNT